LEERYNKSIEAKRSMNMFIILNINTIYENVVNPFFNIGKTIVGNKITARARSMAWYMEKVIIAIYTMLFKT
jgi:hypothetical protein